MLLLPGRQVVKRSPHRRVGYISCPWLQKEQPQYESLLEMYFARIALLCPNLISIASQPFKLDVGDGAFYTPDFALSFPGQKKVIVEVKPRDFVAKHVEKLSAARVCLEEHGFEFLLATEEQIYADDRHQRASMYLRYARSHYSASEVAAARAVLIAQAYPQSLNFLSDALEGSKSVLMHLIGRRELLLNSDLRSEELFYTPEKKESGDGHISASAWLGHTDW